MPTQETAHDGLLDSEQYRPAAIGEASLEAGEPEQVWEEYGLESVPILLDGEDIGRRIIRYNGNYISDVSDHFKVLPNEQVVKAANTVAEELGADPFHEFSGDWYVTLDDHVYQDPERKRVHALYAWDEGTIDDDELEYGFVVHNSIDGSMALRVGLFTFNHACANMVHIGSGTFADYSARDVEEERGVISESARRHTKNMDVELESLAYRIRGVIAAVPDVHETYQQWLQEQLTVAQVEELIDRLPRKNLPVWMQSAAEEFEAVEENEGLDPGMLPEDRRANIVEARMPSAEATWETYNSLTEAIWHDDNTTDTSKMRKMKQLHRVLDPVAAGND